MTIRFLACLMERDSSEFCGMAADWTAGETRRTLRALARRERGHSQMFMNLHESVFQESAYRPRGG